MGNGQQTGFSLSNWSVGQKVAGNYCGIDYEGTISEGRNTPDYHNWILEIDLAEPIMVFGQKRKHICVWTNTTSATVEAVHPYRALAAPTAKGTKVKP